MVAPFPVEHTGESTSGTAISAAGGGGGSGGGGGGSGTSGESKRILPVPFLTKTYELVDDSKINDLISWNEDGTTFIVWRPAEFARDLLPKYFKHNNFSSFVRQLNTYGFKKVVPDRWEFANKCFRRGEKGLLRVIQRRKMSVAVTKANSGDEPVFSSNSSPAATSTSTPTTTPLPMASLLWTCNAGAPELVEENERLRKENAVLREELRRLQSLCGNIYNLMSNYSTNNEPDGRALELLPANPVIAERDVGAATNGCCTKAEEDTSRDRLFGVSIGLKRLRSFDEGGSEERWIQGNDVKCEPVDSGTSDHRNHRSPPWLDKL